MKTELVKYLVTEIEAEQDRLIKYDEEETRLWKEVKETGKRPYECNRWIGKVPHKSVITSNCKMARRLLLEIAREQK